MASPRQLTRSNGFSLVEMMVALVFVLVLMTGMASVFKASLSSFFTSGETTSAGRRNRLSMDVLRDDIDNAGMVLTTLNAVPQTSITQPPIYIMPNMPVIQTNGTITPPSAADPLDPTVADQLAFYVDMPTPFEGTLSPGATTPRSATDLANLGVAPTDADFTYYIDCKTAAYALMIQPGMSFIFKDNYDVGYIRSVSVAGSVVTVLKGASTDAGVTAQSNGVLLPSKFDHLNGTGIVFVAPAQMVLYQVKMLLLDMDLAKPNGVPCLVRDQYNYADVVASGFGGAPTTGGGEQIIAENVQSLKVFMSCNAGGTWAGSELPVATTAMTGWAAIRADLDGQLALVGRPGYTTTENTEQWFRSIPTLVRCDLTTRTAAKRTEFYTPADPNNPTNVVNPYKYLTQSLVFVPRHSGLPLD